MRDSKDLEGQLRESTGGSLSAGVLFKGEAIAPAYLGVNFKTGTSWKAQTAKSQCKPIADSTTLDCASVTIGSPSKIAKQSMGFEFRQKFGNIFGWAPLFSYDFAADAEGKRKLFEVPLYLATDKDDRTGDLTGGVAIGWREGTGAYLAVFVGPKFSIPGF